MSAVFTGAIHQEWDGYDMWSAYGYKKENVKITVEIESQKFFAEIL